MSGIPIEVSLTEFAALSGLTRQQVIYRAERGGIPTRRVTPGNPRSKRVVLLSALQTLEPDLWTAIVMRSQLCAADAA